MIRLDLRDLPQLATQLSVADQVLLSGIVYTARDAAHKRFAAALSDGNPLPFPACNAVLYYTGPTPTPKGLSIGSCGPTTSFRMDLYTPMLYRAGVLATIGKGPRSEEVRNAIALRGGVYFSALGGLGALYASSVDACEEIAYADLGCESVKRLTLRDFPVIVAIDAHGNDLYRERGVVS